MDTLDCQRSYWDSVADKKTFSHPIQMDRFHDLVGPEDKILDYGCGYGRTCAFLKDHGYTDVTGVDISYEMIQRGKRMHDGLHLLHLENSSLPFADNHFSACTLLAVLTCVPTDAGQKQILAELHRVLQPGGIVYLSDYPFQPDQRNQDRYAAFAHEFDTPGVFRLSDGGVVRHHKISWIYELLADFEIIHEETIAILTMNGNDATIFQLIAKKC